MMSKIIIIIAFRDFRDAEYFVPKEILERVGVEIETASNKKGTAVGADGGEVNVDLLISEIDVPKIEGVVFIGGPGCLTHLDNEESYKLIREVLARKKILAAICISPVILAKAGVLKGKKATVWSSPMEKEAVRILKEQGVIYQDQPVVVDEGLITANGPLAAYKFGAAVIELLKKM